MYLLHIPKFSAWKYFSAESMEEGQKAAIIPPARVCGLWNASISGFSLALHSWHPSISEPFYGDRKVAGLQVHPARRVPSASCGVLISARPGYHLIPFHSQLALDRKRSALFYLHNKIKEQTYLCDSRNFVVVLAVTPDRASGLPTTSDISKGERN